MLYLADENVSRLVVDKLRNAGFDVASVSETNPGITDQQILALAAADQRVLITEDHDFGELVVCQRLKVAGVILLELDRLPRSAHAERVLETVSKYEDRVAGNLLVIEGARTRIRRLQI